LKNNLAAKVDFAELWRNDLKRKIFKEKREIFKEK